MEEHRGARSPVHCLAILLCKDIIEDKYSNNKTLVNTFNNIFADHLPFLYHKFCVFCSITEVIQRSQLVLSLKKNDSQKEIMNVQAELTSADPLAVFDLVFILNNIILPEYGTYSVELISEGYYITSRKFLLAPFPTQST